jgi:hypothetical protein
MSKASLGYIASSRPGGHHSKTLPGREEQRESSGSRPHPLSLKIKKYNAKQTNKKSILNQA